ncbi:nucleotide sugar dehydrogenase [Lactococcus lactis subsp. lactis KLDS 4.0325]|uniref:UDP-glucose 6-dehydrogenase n=2 Tax=Lactococcus lactis subsp. cremoris TaxID=1359 RepID=T0SH15_LACLC|nr:nucleotide sugar dehydrogenase [Lactococcus lactis]AGY45544.1 nucleotide sugar dehydrogenase [Lactococcus lactis subsp. lactis KLDS 4.0325]EQC58217.1 hypothetical protein LLT6_10025 [Lactococcus cremoris subsp. cremoris TIFN6]OJH47217.1 UDP-glucose 6-dehydrogenase [Lactococcus lactis subsp. lactis bv. diacetylactis]TRW69663.1 nucleotide sugar dehydrogenase [Lactococcus lactis]
MKIAVVGAGYVGLSLAILLARFNEVFALDIIPEKVEMINKRISPIADDRLSELLANADLNLHATLNSEEAYVNADYIIISTPTSYDPTRGTFDVSSVQKIIKDVLNFNLKALMIIKSTVPVNFTETSKKIFKTDNIIFCPEFLREGNSIEDNLHPSRIIVGECSERARCFASLLESASDEDEVPKVFVSSSEAEAIKLFSNTYLAMRVAFFNELDTFALQKNLSSAHIIQGVALDSRIGNFYNNPSFGYGGYCLPKDTKQLLASCEGVPQRLIEAIVQSNEIRKKVIANQILAYKPTVVGIYRLIMKTGSDNFRDSAILGVIDKLRRAGVEVLVYEPTLKEEGFCNLKIIKNLKDFKQKVDLIVANRLTVDLNDVYNKVFTRDIFQRD